MALMLRSYGTNAGKLRHLGHLCQMGKELMLQRYGTNAAEVLHICYRGKAIMLQS